MNRDFASIVRDGRTESSPVIEIVGAKKIAWVLFCLFIACLFGVGFAYLVLDAIYDTDQLRLIHMGRA